MLQEASIVVEREFPAPVDRVWRAITDKEQLPRWFFEPIEVVPQRKLVFDWLHPGIPGAAIAQWDLSETSAGTRLRITHTGVATFPQDDPAFKRENCEGGWTDFFDRLGEFLKT